MKELNERFALLAMSAVLLILFSCGGSPNKGTVNTNFPDVTQTAITPASSIDPANLDQVTLVDPGASNQGGQIGIIAKQDPSKVLCVIIDPATPNADLEVCQKDKANTSTDSVNGICPESVSTTRCASVNAGSGPDFCEVTGATDYIFVIINPTDKSVDVAYQVIDVTGSSCTALGITEDTITADTLSPTL